MSQKTLLIIVIIFTILIGGLFGAAFYIARDTGQSTGEVLLDFLPFGGEVADRPIVDDRGLTEEGEGTGEEAPEMGIPVGATLSQLTRIPVSGATILGEGASTTVRYMERATGHVYDIRLESGEKSRITNTTLLTVEEVVWNETGNRLILRYLGEDDTIKTFLGEIIKNGGQSPGKITGVFMPDDILFVAPSPDAKEVFYLARFGTRAVGTRVSFENKNLKNVFNFPFAEWLGGWQSAGITLLTTRPSENITGVSYALNMQTGALAKLTQGRGLTSNLSPDANLLLYSTYQSGILESFVLNRKTATTQPLSLSLLPEKCVWGHKNTGTLFCAVPERSFSLETWYAGGSATSDDLWRIDADGGIQTFLVSSKRDARTPIDAVNPVLSKDETYLIFKNKIDNTLWLLKNNPLY
ncbi:MAG: hypothetical protein HY455_00440 [Parcubacteria group bacterium]|nr:hypothetical protein [Parcubacteria group bacterium]